MVLTPTRFEEWLCKTDQRKTNDLLTVPVKLDSVYFVQILSKLLVRCKSYQSEVTWRFRAILRQNSNRVFDVINHWNGQFINWSFAKLKDKCLLFPMVCFLLLSSKRNCLFDIAENVLFSKTRFWYVVLTPTRFGEWLCKIKRKKTNDLKTASVLLDSVYYVQKLCTLLETCENYQSFSNGEGIFGRQCRLPDSGAHTVYQ